MTTEEMRQLIRRMAHAIENVLEGAVIDDGIVSVSALYRLDELYEQDIRPLGPSRMPENNQDVLRAACQAELDFYDWYMDADSHAVVTEVVNRRAALHEQIRAALKS